MGGSGRPSTVLRAGGRRVCSSQHASLFLQRAGGWRGHVHCGERLVPCPLIRDGGQDWGSDPHNSTAFLEEPSHLISGVSFPFLPSPTPRCDGLGFRVSCPGFESQAACPAAGTGESLSFAPFHIWEMSGLGCGGRGVAPTLPSRKRGQPSLVGEGMGRGRWAVWLQRAEEKGLGRRDIKGRTLSFRAAEGRIC